MRGPQGCKMKNKIIPYNPELKLLARKLRKNRPYQKYYFGKKLSKEGLEQYGIQFLRFSNEEVQKNMFSVLLAIQDKVNSLL